MKRIVLAVLCCTLSCTVNALQGDMPLFDGHMHYNEEARGIISPAQVIALWQRLNIKYVLATSRPNDGSLDLIALAKKTAPDITIIPFLRPYQIRSDRDDWFKSARIEAYVDAELKRGIYKGIGEFHIFGKDADAPYVAKIARLAKERGLWLHAHCDEDALERILAHAPGVKVIWAHTGMSTPLPQVDALFAKYPQIIGELSFRSDLMTGDKMNEEWRKLIIKYPARFILGTDTWINQRWDYVPELITYYRKALASLPPEVAEAVAFRNGLAALK
jgi:Amidohydrolase